MGWPAAERSLTAASPEAWGYTLSNGKLHRQDDAFTLHLVGMKEQDFEFSASLMDSGALKLHEGVDTLEYYRLIGQMVSPTLLASFAVCIADRQDIVLPAFRNERYVTERASASIPAAVMAQVSRLSPFPLPSLLSCEFSAFPS